MSVDRSHPEGSDDLVASLLRGVPEFLPACRTLVDACDDDPGEPLVLMELAEFVSLRMAAIEVERPPLERALAAVEDHLSSIAGDRIGFQLVAFAFFDSFSPEHRRLLAPRLGPRSRVLAGELDLPDIRWESSG